MHGPDNPDTTAAIKILRGRGYHGITVSGAVDILVAAGFRPSRLTAVSLDDCIEWANLLRAMDGDALALVKQEMRR